MRLWHYKLIPYLPNKMLISQWRECIAIKRQWEKGTLKHPLVSYIMEHNKKYFRNYIYKVIIELDKRHINFNEKLYEELIDFCFNDGSVVSTNLMYPEHDESYLIQCIYNLQEKAYRGIITHEEWERIDNMFSIGEFIWLGDD